MSRESKQRRSAESRRRAWTHLQKLDWLAGYPAPGDPGRDGDGVRWRTLTGAAFALEGDRVARSRRAARIAMAEHRDALADLVGDVERWWRIVDAALAWCSAPRGELDLLDHAPPRLARAARELARRRPALRPAILAAGVAWALAPEELARVMGWLDAHPAVDELPLALVLSLAQLTRHGGGDALLALLALDAPAPGHALEEVERLLAKLRDGRRAQKQLGRKRRRKRNDGGPPAASSRKPGEKADAPAPPRCRAKVEAWITRLAAREPAEQARAMALLEVAKLAEALVPWQEWEQKHAPRLARAAQLAARPFDAFEEWENNDRALGGVVAIKAAAPERFDIDDALDEIFALATAPERLHFQPAIVRLLAAQPDALGPQW